MRKYKIEEKEFNEINITPFTDVVLVLLLIFMIASPFIVSGAIKVKLPSATNTDTSPSQSNTVYLTKYDEIYMNGKKVTLVELNKTASDEFLKRHNTEVVINADENAKHGDFVRLVDILKGAGATKFSIATEKQNNK